MSLIILFKNKDQNYLSYARSKSFLKQMLFHSLYEVSIEFSGTVFSENDVVGTCLNGGQKNQLGGGSTLDDVML